MTEETLPDQETGESEKRTRLSEAEWAEIRELYELGKARMVDLAKDYNVSRQTLSRRFKDEGISYGSRVGEVAAAANAGATAAVASSTGAAVAAALERFNDKRLGWIEETRVVGYNSLKQADMIAKRIIAEAVKNKAPMASTGEDLKAVQRFQKILVENTLSRLEILNADQVIDEDNLPEIHFSDLTQEDILAHHRGNSMFPDDATDDDLLAELNEYEGLIE